jgi:dTDP-4-amino-4,6-dideoxygalactose transaminase
LGAQPAFEEPLHVGRPNVGSRELLFNLLGQALDRSWLTNSGPLVEQFEKQVADYVGVKHCVAFCNATIALEIAIRAAKLDGEVIVPSFTFVATAHALQWQQITPLFCDIDPIDHCLDPTKVEAMITPSTTGIIAVHLWGHPCNTEALAQIAERRNLTVIYDAAHAFGCSRGSKMIGSFGKAEIFSFHATKFFNTFEGGAVVTNDSEFADEVRLMRNFGFAGYDNVVMVGTNGKMTEASAAMGLTNFESLTRFVETNRSHFESYRKHLDGVTGVRLLSYELAQRPNFQYVVAEIDEAASGLHRDQLLRVLHAENVLARRYFWPGCHRMEPYRTLFPHAGASLPMTERIADRVLVLPTGTGVTPAAIETICNIIRNGLAAASTIRDLPVSSRRT